jgi:hypothetical protein
MKNSFLIIIVILFFLEVSISYGQNSQDSTIIYRIETKDGNEYIGNIIYKDGIKLHVKTLNIGVIELNSADVNKITEIKKDEMKDGVAWYQILQSSRYFWSPNGYGLAVGESYYQNIWVLYNQISTGITNNFSIGLGLIPLFLFAGAPTPVWITPKFSIPVVKDKFNIGLGALSGVIIAQNALGFGIVYGIATYGSHDNNLTFGMGYGYAEKTWADHPIITLSGMIRTGKKSYLLTENYIFSFGNSRTVLSILGGRSIIRIAGLDYGLAIPFYSDMSSFVAIPWLGLTIPIEAKNHK